MVQEIIHLHSYNLFTSKFINIICKSIWAVFNTGAGLVLVLLTHYWYGKALSDIFNPNTKVSKLTLIALKKFFKDLWIQFKKAL